MASGASTSAVLGKGKKVDKTRRCWNSREEEVLIHSLKDIITKGWKTENGFKAGYLAVLESEIQASIPGSNLRGNPHINSKIHVWKKTYGNVVTILSKSGVGWNYREKIIEATDETWESIIQVDPNLRALRHKQWTYYDAWCDIFGNDCATGEQSKTFESALQDVLKLPDESLYGNTQTSNNNRMEDDSVSDTHTPLSKPTVAVKSKKKRKQSTEVDESLVVAIKDLAHITKSTMGDLLKQLATSDKLSDTQDEVLDALQGLQDISEDDQLRAAQLLYNNHNELALFKRLGEAKRINFVKKLLHGD